MPRNPANRVERSVETLQKIYAVLVAFALAQAIQLLLPAHSLYRSAEGSEFTARLPGFLAFLFTVLQFYHGMNCHLDQCYLDRQEPEVGEGVLLFDFSIFCVEGSIFVAAANSIGSGLKAFALLGVLLGVDSVWALLSHWIHYRRVKPSVIRWSMINAAAVALGLGIGLNVCYSDGAKAWLLVLLGITRSVADYASMWDLYFPKGRNSGTYSLDTPGAE